MRILRILDERFKIGGQILWDKHGNSNSSLMREEGELQLSDTHEFVEKLNDNQRKIARSKRGNGGEKAGSALPGKQHSTNK